MYVVCEKYGSLALIDILHALMITRAFVVAGAFKPELCGPIVGVY
jgi:hypothetical protein